VSSTANNSGVGLGGRLTLLRLVVKQAQVSLDPSRYASSSMIEEEGTWKMPFVGRLVLAMAMWSARNVLAAVGMPCEDMLRLLDNFAFYVLVSSCVGLGIWLVSLSMVKEVG
jgi:hypothetical protein